MLIDSIAKLRHSISFYWHLKNITISQWDVETRNSTIDKRQRR